MKLIKMTALAGFLGWATAGCVGQVNPDDPGSTPGGSGGVAGGGTGSATGTGSTPGGSGGGAATGTGSGGSVGGGGAGVVAGSGGAIGGTGSGGAISGTGGAAVVQCNAPAPGRAPLRRLTTFEYNNTVRDLVSDATNPGNDFPSEILGNGFGNDADSQSVSSLLAGGYVTVAEGIAARATANATALGKLASCASNVTTANEESCAKTIMTALLPRAYRRTVTTAEVDDYMTLYRTVRAVSSTIPFASGVAAILEAVLQSPEFLYRVEFGTTDPANPSVKKLTGREIATRLSYFLWQTMPDVALTTAADGGMLATPAGVKTEATRMLNDSKSHPMVSFFFDNLLPISILTGLERDKTLFPTFTSAVGQSMRQETERFLEYEIFENTTQAPGSSFAPGSWPAALTAPYTFVNQALFNYYGAASFTGKAPTTATLEKVELNTSQRLGLLTQGGLMAGTTTTNLTNPVLRGSFVVQKLMCRTIPLPSGDILAMVKPPDPYSGKTSRDRYTQHSAQPVCQACHQYMDPVGLALENYDAIGLYRTTEHTVINGAAYDTQIDATGAVPGVAGAAANGVELVKLLASSDDTQNCFATHWMEFAYGRTLGTEDACNKQTLQTAFKSAGYNVKQLLLSLTQTDGFLYRPAQ